MVKQSNKIIVLKAVVAGSTLSQAGASVGISASRARDMLPRICREIGLSSSIKDIRSSPDIYIKAINNLEKKPVIDLRSRLISSLISVLQLNDVNDLTPQYLSNITSSQLIERGVSMIAISEIQEWLSSNDTSLKQSQPKNNSEIKMVKQAIAILDSFKFDTSFIKDQLSNIDR